MNSYAFLVLLCGVSLKAVVADPAAQADTDVARAPEISAIRLPPIVTGKPCTCINITGGCRDYCPITSPVIDVLASFIQECRPQHALITFQPGLYVYIRVNLDFSVGSNAYVGFYDVVSYMIRLKGQLFYLPFNNNGGTACIRLKPLLNTNQRSVDSTTTPHSKIIDIIRRFDDSYFGGCCSLSTYLPAETPEDSYYYIDAGPCPTVRFAVSRDNPAATTALQRRVNDFGYGTIISVYSDPTPITGEFVYQYASYIQYQCGAPPYCSVRLFEDVESMLNRSQYNTNCFTPDVASAPNLLARALGDAFSRYFEIGYVTVGLKMALVPPSGCGPVEYALIHGTTLSPAVTNAYGEILRGR